MTDCSKSILTSISISVSTSIPTSVSTGTSRDLELALKIAKDVQQQGGQAFYVGGFVRDGILGIANKDMDIEVHGLEPSVLESILDRYGTRISIGESFGIYNIKGYSIDFAMPRKEELRGKGHRDFYVFVDPFIGTYKAAMRRDFTINAIMQDIITGQLVDHFDGLSDLKAGIIRHVCDKSFAEDPLRVLRAAQFAARFEYEIAEETLELCKQIDLSTLSRERVEAELKKALLKSSKPSIFFGTLRKMSQLQVWFPEVEQLIGIEQNPVFHPEGDVWTHTMQVLDEAVQYREEVENPFAFMLSAIAHDLGKIICTEEINGVIHAYKHEIEGLPLVESFLERFTQEKNIIRYVLNLTEHHMRPNIVAEAHSAIKSTNKMFDVAVDPKGLIFLALADKGSRKEGCGNCGDESTDGKCDKGDSGKSGKAFLLERLKIYNEYMSRPFVGGEDLIAAGLKPGVHFKDMIEHAHKLRLVGIPKDAALKQVLAHGRKKYGNKIWK